MAEEERQVQAAIERLPLKEGIEPNSEARLLCFSVAMLSMNDLNAMKAAPGKDGAKIELVRFAKLAEKLAKEINSMHADTLAAFTDVKHPFGLRLDLMQSAASARRHAELIPLANTQSRAKKIWERQVAERVAIAFKCLTNRDPKIHHDPVTNEPRGPFYQFLKSVFEAFEIDASAEYFGKEADTNRWVVGTPGGVVSKFTPASVREITQKK